MRQQQDRIDAIQKRLDEKGIIDITSTMKYR